MFAKYQLDKLIHLAAESHVNRSIDSYAAFIETNLLGTYILLEAARHYWQPLSAKKKPGFHCHHISTNEVYGAIYSSRTDCLPKPYPLNSPSS